MTSCRADGRAMAAVVNEKLQMAVQFEWSVRSSILLEWLHLREAPMPWGLNHRRMMSVVDAVARADGSMIWLGARRVPRLPFHVSVITGSVDIGAAVSAIQALQRQPTSDVPA